MNNKGNKTKLWALGGFIAVALVIVQAMARKPNGTNPLQGVDARTATYATGPFEAVRPEAGAEVEEDIDDDAPDSELAAEEEATIDPLATPDLATAQEHAAAVAADEAVVESMPSESPESLQAALNYIEWIKTIPEAAPLLEEVIEYMKTASDDEFSLANLPRAENGLAYVPKDASTQMIKDPEIRAKWDKLMALIARAEPSKSGKPQGAAADVKKQ